MIYSPCAYCMPSNVCVCWLTFQNGFWGNIQKEDKAQGNKNTWGNKVGPKVHVWGLKIHGYFSCCLLTSAGWANNQSKRDRLTGEQV